MPAGRTEYLGSEARSGTATAGLEAAGQDENTATLLEMLSRRGYRVPHACRNGVCHLCRARLLSGAVEPEGAVFVEAGVRWVLLCKAHPTEDCCLFMDTLRSPGVLPVQTVAMQVVAVEPMGYDVWRARLLAPAGHPPEWHAGQYLQLLIPEADRAYFSIASPPGRRELSLHIQVAEGQGSAMRILDYLRSETLVKVRLPMGKCCISTVPEGPMVFVAAGTGFSQIESMVEWLLHQNIPQPEIYVFWGVRRSVEFYDLDTLRRWELDRSIPCYTVSADNQDNDWSGHHGELVRILTGARIDWRRARVFASGSPTMVYALLDALEALGLPADSLYSDVLEYAPRPRPAADD